jgi:hypothetical protein
LAAPRRYRPRQEGICLVVRVAAHRLASPTANLRTLRIKLLKLGKLVRISVRRLCRRRSSLNRGWKNRSETARFQLYIGRSWWSPLAGSTSMRPIAMPSPRNSFVTIAGDDLNLRVRGRRVSYQDKALASECASPNDNISRRGRRGTAELPSFRFLMGHCQTRE